MASRSLRRIRGWGHLRVSCQAPLDRLRYLWTSPFFARPIQHNDPDKSRFLVRPQLLTRYSSLPVGRDITR